jgi:tight adherence protein B
VRPAALAALIGAGVPLSQALEVLEVEEVEDPLIRLALEVGAPLVPTLNFLDEQLAHQERTQAEIRQAQAIPLATRKLLLWLPAGTVLMSELAGLETLQGLMQPAGLVALAFAIALLVLGAKLSGRILKRLKPPDSSARELLALQICLSSGMGLQQLRRTLPKLSDRAQELISMSQQTGASLSNLLVSEVAASNQRAVSESLTQAKKLSVALLIPLAATTLPAFLLLTIVPMIIGITQ